MKQLKIENWLRPRCSLKYQELLFSFSGIPFVGQNIFQALPDEDLKRCRLVCKSWKGLIDDPLFWLKKLNDNGQPKEVHQEWLDLIEKAKSHGVDKTKFVSSLMTKYFMFKETRFQLMDTVSWISPKIGKAIKKNQNCLEKFFLSLPPIYIALLPENPNLEIIEVMTYFYKDFAKPIIVPKEVRKNSFIFPSHIDTSMYNKSLNPLTFALERRVKEVSVDVIKLLASKIKEPMKCTNDRKETPLNIYIYRNDLEMCKYFVEMLPIKNQMKIITAFNSHLGGSAIWKALGKSHVDIFEYLLSKVEKPEKAGKRLDPLLHRLTEHYTAWKCPKTKSCKYAQMFRILVPKLTKFQEYGSEGYTPLHNAITRLNNDENDECAKEMVKYLVPRTNLEMTERFGRLTPIDLANAGVRKILISCKRKIISSETKSKKRKIMK